MNTIGEIIKSAAWKFFSVFRDGSIYIVGKIVSWFGVTLVTWNAILPDLKGFVENYVADLPDQAKVMMSALGVDQALSMILSALVIRLAWKVFFIPTSVAQSMGMGQ